MKLPSIAYAALLLFISLLLSSCYTGTDSSGTGANPIDEARLAEDRAKVAELKRQIAASEKAIAKMEKRGIGSQGVIAASKHALNIDTLDDTFALGAAALLTEEKNKLARLKKDLAKVEKDIDRINKENDNRVARNVSSDLARSMRGMGYNYPDPPKVDTHVDRPAAPPPSTGGMMCFVAGTLVHTTHGTMEIQKIEPGDLVLSYDESSGKTSPARVLQTFKSERADLVEITCRGGLLTCSQNHRFYTDGRKWVPASKLSSEKLMTLDATSSTLHPSAAQVQASSRREPVNVYNLMVESNHNYFVGADAILCHNHK